MNAEEKKAQEIIIKFVRDALKQIEESAEKICQAQGVPYISLENLKGLNKAFLNGFIKGATAEKSEKVNPVIHPNVGADEHSIVPEDLNPDDDLGTYAGPKKQN